MNIQIEQPRDGGHPIRGKVLWVEADGSVVLGDDLGGLLRFDPPSGQLTKLAHSPLSPRERLQGRSHLMARMLRQTARAFLRLPSGTFLWTAGGRLWRQPLGADRATCTFRFPIGHGPLFLAGDPAGSVYWGEYVARRGRYPCALYRSSNDGETWEQIHCFSVSEVRHVHGMFWDAETARIWFTTGDADHESALWWIEGDRPVRVASGPLFRIVQPVFTPEHILFGTDTPGQSCAIYAMNRSTGRVDHLVDVRGPVYYASRAGEWIAFSTTVEPLHPGNRAGLYLARLADLNFTEVLSLKKDRWPWRIFQYGQIYLPQNATTAPVLWITPWATPHDGQVLRLLPLDGEAE